VNTERKTLAYYKDILSEEMLILTSLMMLKAINHWKIEYLQKPWSSPLHALQKPFPGAWNIGKKIHVVYIQTWIWCKHVTCTKHAL